MQSEIICKTFWVHPSPRDDCCQSQEVGRHVTTFSRPQSWMREEISVSGRTGTHFPYWTAAAVRAHGSFGREQWPGSCRICRRNMMLGIVSRRASLQPRAADGYLLFWCFVQFACSLPQEDRSGTPLPAAHPVSTPWCPAAQRPTTTPAPMHLAPR